MAELARYSDEWCAYMWASRNHSQGEIGEEMQLSSAAICAKIRRFFRLVYPDVPEWTPRRPGLKNYFTSKGLEQASEDDNQPGAGPRSKVLDGERVSTRVFNVLTNVSATTWDKVAAIPDLYAIQNCGRSCVEEIEGVLERRNGLLKTETHDLVTPDGRWRIHVVIKSLPEA